MKKLLRLSLFGLVASAALISTTFADIPAFNIDKDFLLANYDCKPDKDDIHASAAFASMLKRPEYAKIKHHAVFGAYGVQKASFLEGLMPEYATLLFGEKGEMWSDAHSEKETTIKRVSNILENALKTGNVFIAEAGQSDITYDVMQDLLKKGIDKDLLKSKVFVVQHSNWNEKATDKEKLKWVKANTSYSKIDDGNRGDNATPGYVDKSKNFIAKATSTDNTNEAIRNIWIAANEKVFSTKASWENKSMKAGGADYSDQVEIWWILGKDENINTSKKFLENIILKPIAD